MTYPKKKISKHSTVRIPKSMLLAIEEFLKTDEAKKLGFLHITDVVTAAVREFMNNRRFEHFNLDVEKGIVRVLDRQLGVIADVYFRRKDTGPVIICEWDRSSKCDHVKYALTIPKIKDTLYQNGWIVTEDFKIKRKPT
ncbi:MAG: hypothetical protein QXI91_07625 [Candidatus Bathyarchaeia archaeon]